MFTISVILRASTLSIVESDENTKTHMKTLMTYVRQYSGIVKGVINVCKMNDYPFPPNISK